MEHPNIEVVRRWFAAFENADLDGAREIMASDAVLSVRTPAHLAGEYVGFDAFLEFYARKRAGAGDDFDYQVDDLLAGDGSAAAVLTLSDTRDGVAGEWKQVAIYRIEGEHIVGINVIEEDPARRTTRS